MDRCDLSADFGAWEGIDVVFGKINTGFERCDEAYKLLFYWGYVAGERASELLGGDACLMERGGFDEVSDCFGLGEVEAAGEEGALSEFAGFC